MRANTTQNSSSPSYVLTAGTVSRGDTMAELLLGTLALLTRGFARGGELRRDIKRLSAMDDRMLRDIGISRGDIEHAVRHGRD